MDCNEHDDGVVSIAVSKIHELNDISVVQMTNPGNKGEHPIVKPDSPYHMGCTLRNEALFGTYSHILEHKNDQKNCWDRIA